MYPFKVRVSLSLKTDTYCYKTDTNGYILLQNGYKWIHQCIDLKVQSGLELPSLYYSCVNFSRVWKKSKLFENYWWKFHRKIDFLNIFGKFFTKIRSIGNNIIFLEHFFSFWEGIFYFPLATPLIIITHQNLPNFLVNIQLSCHWLWLTIKASPKILSTFEAL